MICVEVEQNDKHFIRWMNRCKMFQRVCVYCAPLSGECVLCLCDDSECVCVRSVCSVCALCMLCCVPVCL